MIILMLFAALIVAVRYPETPAGRFMRRWLIEKPGDLIASLTFRKLIGGMVFLIAIYAIAQALPMEFALLGAVDASAFTEILIAASLLAANIRARAVLKAAQTAIQRSAKQVRVQVRALGQRGRSFGRAVARTRSRIKLPAPDDDGGRGPAFA